MKIKLTFKITDFYYTAPIIVQNYSLIKNQVLNISIFQDDKFLSTIDLIALPNFHQYNLLEWQYTLENFFQFNNLNLENILLDAPLFNMVKSKKSRAIEGELLFIIESVLFSVIEKCAPQVLSFIEKRPIKINALYSSSMKKESLPECLKIKIRPNLNNLNETIELIKSLFKQKPDILLRLDGNRRFELSDLTSYIEKLERGCGPLLFSAIEYIEEPLKNAYDFHSFNQIYSYAIALDESLEVYKNKLTQLRNFPEGLNLILKPSIFGISKSFEILKYASRFHHNVVISSTYETATAIRPLLYLAALTPGTYHGLDTLKFLPKDLSIESENYSLNF
ncbi:MAG: hypothetical protein PHY93_06650 [Bacteriovorax sp.]|nr:hypothetical protein [Bacteriovorax sp.]